MTTENHCPNCGKALAGEALLGLCPECLIKAGVPTCSEAGGQVAGGNFVPPTPEELARINPQLEILELIGRGGMGAVYKARQKQLDRLVAVKILPPGIGDNPAFAERFTREAKALAKLNHPNIVTLHEFGQTDGLFYFIMEFVDGLNLRQLLEAGRIAPREALAIVPQICDALQYAHDASIVHRDIKPENILLDRQGRVKVADFGLAKIVSQSGTGILPVSSEADTGKMSVPPDFTEAGKVMGTPQYMAPEQTDHPSEVDHRADIYSLGVVFYQMLTGELPAGQPFAPPSRKVLIDVRLDEIVLRALEKEPERRYQQASVLKTRVETIAASEGGEGKSVSAADAAPKDPHLPPSSGRVQRIGGIWLPLVGVHAGRRTIYWPGILYDSLIVAGIYGVGWLAVTGLLTPLWGRPAWEFGLGWVIGSVLVLVGWGIWRGFKMPVEKLVNLDRPPPTPAPLQPGTPVTPIGGRDARAAQRPSGTVSHQIQAAAIGLLAAAILEILYLAVYNYYLSKALLPEFDAYSLMLLRLSQAASSLILPCVIIFGALKMKRLASYGWGLAAALLAIFPALTTLASFLFRFAHQYFPAGAVLWPGFVVPGLILVAGVFALIVLSRKEVRAAFPTGPATRGQAGPRLAAVALLLLCAGGGLLWAQRPQKLGEFVEQESPDNYYTASVGTWHAMRLFGSDRLTYRFNVQGLGGSVSERWEIPIPSGKLATNYLAPSISDLTFDKHGHIEWLADSSSVKFMVRDVEVARYDVPKRKGSIGPATSGPETGRTPVQVDKTSDAAVLAVGAMLRGMKEQVGGVGVTYYDAERDETGDPWVLTMGKDQLGAERIGAAGLDMRLGDKPEEFATSTGLGAAYVERSGRMVPLNGTLLFSAGSAPPREGARGSAYQWEFVRRASQLEPRELLRCMETARKRLDPSLQVRSGDIIGLLTNDGDLWFAQVGEVAVKSMTLLSQPAGRMPLDIYRQTVQPFAAVVELIVPDWDGGRSGAHYIDLDAGRMLAVPAELKKDEFGRTRHWYQWQRRSGVDLEAVVKEDTFYGNGMDAAGVQVDNNQWDMLSPARLATHEALGRRQSHDPILTLKDFPVTYAVKTREGGMGILQFTGFTDNPRGVKIRYKMITRPFRLSPPAFAPLIESVVNDWDEGHGNEALDLRTGTLVNMPAVALRDRNAWDDWLRVNRMDLLADFAQDRWALLGVGLSLSDFPAGKWDEAFPAELVAALASETALQRIERSGQVFYLLPEQPKWPVTFAFKTRAGDQGLLQITGATDRPNGLKIRYKLGQDGSATLPR